MPKRTSKPDINQIAYQIVEASTKSPQAKRASKPLGVNQIASEIIEVATAIPHDLTASAINRAAAALGRLGGLKGGPARAKKLTSKKRSQIAKKAADARWSKKH